MRSFLVFLGIVLILISCDPVQKEESNIKVNVDQNLVTLSSDSIDILYFTKPFTDSSRYTRYYSAVKISDSAFYQAVDRALKGRSAVLEKPRSCMSEGKIIIPKGGDAFKVVYFSRSAESACSYLYDIKEGLFHYYPLPNDIRTALNSFESLSVKVQ